MNKERTTINVKKQIREELKKLRKYQRETYDETLERVINNELQKFNIKQKLRKGKI